MNLKSISTYTLACSVLLASSSENNLIPFLNRDSGSVLYALKQR